jgi:hypothetical protein
MVTARRDAPAAVRMAKMLVSELRPAPYNPRRIDPAAMAGLTKSMERFGVVQPIIINARSGNTVIGGHQRLKVLRAKKVRETDVVIVDLSDIDERALNVALNSDALSGSFTDDLQGLLAEIEAADGQLFADLRLGDLLAEIESNGDFAERADDAPELPKVAVTQPGDVWTLGRHRLICGDSANEDVIARLLGTERVDCLVTDPPYGVDYGAKNALMNSLDGAKRIEKTIGSDEGGGVSITVGSSPRSSASSRGPITRQPLSSCRAPNCITYDSPSKTFG